ncbi:transposase [Streptomyces sp. NPDC093228]|uniref:transposase n=1 Tax=Streptomyces sp. NPDC093228 TaxID=3155070 RepID=UPI0034208311
MTSSTPRRPSSTSASPTGCGAIRRLPGIGLVLAAVFVAEIGDVHRFTAAEKL